MVGALAYSLIPWPSLVMTTTKGSQRRKQGRTKVCWRTGWRLNIGWPLSWAHCQYCRWVPIHWFHRDDGNKLQVSGMELDRACGAPCRNQAETSMCAGNRISYRCRAYYNSVLSGLSIGWKAVIRPGGSSKCSKLKKNITSGHERLRRSGESLLGKTTLYSMYKSPKPVPSKIGIPSSGIVSTKPL